MFVSLLLKKALPFALTFAAGTALGGLTWLSGAAGRGAAEAESSTRTYEFGRRCRMGRHRLVAESKPLAILFKPDARWPLGAGPAEGARPALVRVTFGADGRVQEVGPLSLNFRGGPDGLVEMKTRWEAVERAARLIQFTPETVNSVPVTVTRDVEIRFMGGD